jgi:hypothetical protein
MGTRALKECPVCHKNFGNVKLHMRNKHEVVPEKPAVLSQKTVAEQTRIPDKVLRKREAGENLTPLQRMQAANPTMEVAQVEIDDPVNARTSNPMSPRQLQSLGWRHPQGYSVDNPMIDESNPVYCFMMKPKADIQKENMERDPRFVQRRHWKEQSVKQRLRQGTVTRIGKPMTVGQMMDSFPSEADMSDESSTLAPEVEGRLEAAIAGAYDESGE